MAVCSHKPFFLLTGKGFWWKSELKGNRVRITDCRATVSNATKSPVRIVHYSTPIAVGGGMGRTTGNVTKSGDLPLPDDNYRYAPVVYQDNAFANKSRWTDPMAFIRMTWNQPTHPGLVCPFINKALSRWVCPDSYQIRQESPIAAKGTRGH